MPTRSRRSTPKERWETAIHEAGHAVASIRLGFTVGVVSIERRTGTRGHMVDVSDFSLDEENDRIRTEEETHELAAVVCYAGLAAEAHFGLAKYSWHRAARHGAWEDDRIAREVHLAMIYAAPADVDAAIVRCREAATSVVEKYASEVQRLAEFLLEFTTLVDCEIECALGIPSVAAAVGAERLQERRKTNKKR